MQSEHKNVSLLFMKECYLKIFLEDTRKLLSLNFVVVYPRVDGHCWILGTRNAI